MSSGEYFVYILTNKNNTVFYIGVTNNIYQRLLDHREKTNKKSFTAKYKIYKLVYIESAEDAYTAISREKQLKRWHREWKINLIKKDNPNFEDLSGNYGLPSVDFKSDEANGDSEINSE